MSSPKSILDAYTRKSFKHHPRLLNKSAWLEFMPHVQRVYGREVVLFSVDVEAWERDNSIITEIGVSIFDPLCQRHAIMPSIESYHIIPRENSNYKNGRFVPDNSRFFSGKATHVMDMEDAISFVNTLISQYFEAHPLGCCMVGHDLRGDVKWLKSLGIIVPEPYLKLDTQRLLSFSTGRQWSLTNCLRLLEIPHSHLHNAGNDAYYTLLLALKACDPTARERFGLDKTYPLELSKVDKSKKGTCHRIEVHDVDELVFGLPPKSSDK